MGVVLDVVIIGAVVGFWVVWIVGITRSLRVPTEVYAAVGRRKPQTVLVVVFVLLVGALWYLLVVQRELDAVDLPDEADAEHGVEVTQVELDDDSDDDLDGDVTRA